MKNVILVLVLLSLLVTPAFAYNAEIFDEVEVGAKVDMPDLIKITNAIFIGAEVGTDSIHNWMNDVEDDASAYAILKATIKWTLVDFSK